MVNGSLNNRNMEIYRRVFVVLLMIFLTISYFCELASGMKWFGLLDSNYQTPAWLIWSLGASLGIATLPDWLSKLCQSNRK